MMLQLDFIVAVMGGSETVSYLLQHGFDVNIRNNDIAAQLHIAAVMGLSEAVNYLMQYGAYVSIRHNDAATRLHSSCYGRFRNC